MAANDHWEAKSLMKMSHRRPSWAYWPTGRFLGPGDHMAAHWWPTHRLSLMWPAPLLPYSRLGYSKPQGKHSEQPHKQPTHSTGYKRLGGIPKHKVPRWHIGEIPTCSVYYKA